jgi:hypothetical protein
MKPPLSASAPTANSADAAGARTRRRAVVGAGAAAAAALAAAALARRTAPRETVAETKTDAAGSDGYRLTEHIRRYYETTRT